MIFTQPSLLVNNNTKTIILEITELVDSTTVFTIISLTNFPLLSANIMKEMQHHLLSNPVHIWENSAWPQS